METYAQRKRVTKVLEGAVLGNLFFEPSTRTRISFGTAFNRLGGSVRDTAGFDITSLVKGESLYDMARVVGGYVDVVAVRHPQKGSVAEFAEAINIPVINAGDGSGEHPTQALLDLYTIQKELGRGLQELRGLQVALVGDLKFGRAAHSFARIVSMLEGVEIRCISPAELSMPPELATWIRDRGAKVVETQSLADGLTDADVVYSTRVQQERFEEPQAYLKFRGSYAIGAEQVSRYCKPTVLVMHPLPRDSRPGAASDLSNDLNGNPNLAIFRQSDNGIPIRMALFALVLGVADQVSVGDQKANWFVPESVGRIDR